MHLNALVRLFFYLWAAPNTAIGLTIGLVTMASGGHVQLREGVLEFCGGFACRLLSCALVRSQAMTLGHVIIGNDHACLERLRPHERAHVRQAEHWGPLFLVAYGFASIWASLSGGHYYRDNWFERDARRRSGE